MPQALANVLVHVVFSTKNRAAFLQSSHLREAVNAYLVGALRNLKCPSVIVNCVSDHVHILCQLARTVSLAELLEEIKSGSSAWLKTQDPSLASFYWQSGYGAFSVSQSNAEQVKRYIADQEERHRTMSFQEELRELLKRHGLEYDERYVWD